MAKISHFLLFDNKLLVIYNINMIKNITPKQKRALDFIYKSFEEFGFPPSMAELREGLDVLYNQSVLNILKYLEDKCYIKRDKGVRGIKILPLGYKILGKNQLVPFVGDSSAGPFIESLDNMVTKWTPLTNNVLANERIEQSQEEVFIIQVHGDSMINANVSDGDILLIKKTNEFRSGDIVVARSDDGTTVKRFVAESDGRAYLKPENPAYKNIPIFEETVFDGKVIANLSLINRLNQ